jgi:hypothetical protein
MPPKWKTVISAKQRQIKAAPVNMFKNLFIEKKTGRSGVKSSLGWTMSSSVVNEEFINRGN